MRRGALTSYILRRLLVLAVMLVILSFVIFSLLYLTPGDAIDALLGSRPRTPATEELLRAQYHLDQPFLTQYGIWASNLLQGNLGTSTITGVPVAAEIGSRLGTSVALGALAYILTMAIGVPLGLWAALRRSSAIDRGIVSSVIFGYSTPVFVIALLLLYVFAVVLGWFPVFGAGDGGLDSLWHLTLPALALAIGGVALIVKHTRAAMIDVFQQEYVTFARARGLSSSRVLWLYGMRNGLIPVVTVSVPLLAALVTGAVLVEVTFSIQGIGDLLVQSASTKDLPTLQAIGLLVAAFIMLTNLVADMVYLGVDPRIRLGKEAS